MSILAGLVGERFLLVLPLLGTHGAWPAAAAMGITCGLLGAFLLATDPLAGTPAR